MNKKDCLFTKSHEWLYVENGEGYIGISSYATAHLGDIVFLDLPQVGRILKQGETFGGIESVKSASDLYMPVSGEIIEVNQALADQPELISNDPFNTFIIKIKITNPAELKDLLNLTDYEDQLE